MKFLQRTKAVYFPVRANKKTIIQVYVEAFDFIARFYWSVKRCYAAVWGFIWKCVRKVYLIFYPLYIEYYL